MTPPQPPRQKYVQLHKVPVCPDAQLARKASHSQPSLPRSSPPAPSKPPFSPGFRAKNAGTAAKDAPAAPIAQPALHFSRAPLHPHRSRRLGIRLLIRNQLPELFDAHLLKGNRQGDGRILLQLPRCRHRHARAEPGAAVAAEDVPLKMTVAVGTSVTRRPPHRSGRGR